MIDADATSAVLESRHTVGLHAPNAQSGGLREAEFPSSEVALRVLLIAEACGGGAGRHVLDLAEGLLGRGCEVHLLHSQGRTDRFFRDRLHRAKELKHICMSMRRGIHPRDFGALAAVRRYIRDAGPFDVIHGHASKGGALARLAALGTSAPALYTLHGFVAMDPSVALPKRILYHTLEWALSRVSDRIVAVSPEEQRFCIRGGLGRSRVVLIPNGIPTTEFPARLQVRHRLGLADGDLVVGFIGRLVDPKAPHVLLEAAATTAQSVPRFRLAVVGSGPLEDSLRAQAASLGIDHRVLWLGERPAHEMLPAFDLFALPSRKEGLPYVVLEAMAAGLPIVATSSAGVELLVQPGENGLVVPRDRPDLFAAALTDLLSDPGRLERFGRTSRARASRFTVERMVDRTLAEYVDCLRTSGRAEQHRGRCSVSHSRNNGATRQRTVDLIQPRPDSIEPRETSTHSISNSTHRTTREPQPITVHATAGKGGTMAAKPRSAELHPGPGFRVKLDFPRLDPGMMDRFREFPTPDISDLLNRLYAVDPQIRCLTGPEHRLCGPACTVKVFPGDNLMVHKSLDVARPGDIIVVDSGGSTSNAVLGDLVSAKARHRRIAGFVVDGLIRDLPEIMTLDFPVFARGTTPIGPLHRGPGEINFPICCGGIVVNPGDLIVADAAGAIVVPREIAAELLQRLELHKATNQAYFDSVRRGEFSNQWVDRLLEEQHCPYIGTPDRNAIPEEPIPGHGCAPANGLAATLMNGTAARLAPARDAL